MAKNKKSGEYFAMKRLKKADILKLHQTDHVISENTILADIEHPFLVSLGLHLGDLGRGRRQTSSGKGDDLACESRLPANGLLLGDSRRSGGNGPLALLTGLSY